MSIEIFKSELGHANSQRYREKRIGNVEGKRDVAEKSIKENTKHDYSLSIPWKCRKVSGKGGNGEKEREKESFYRF